MSQAMNDLRGSLVALVTPMTASGAIDWAALDGLVDWHLESGHRVHSGRAGRRCRLLSVGDAVLQQANSGGPLPALLHHC